MHLGSQRYVVCFQWTGSTRMEPEWVISPSRGPDGGVTVPRYRLSTLSARWLAKRSSPACASPPAFGPEGANLRKGPLDPRAEVDMVSPMGESRCGGDWGCRPSRFPPAKWNSSVSPKGKSMPPPTAAIVARYRSGHELGVRMGHYSFPVRLLHPLHHAGISRRTTNPLWQVAHNLAEVAPEHPTPLISPKP